MMRPFLIYPYRQRSFFSSRTPISESLTTRPTGEGVCAVFAESEVIKQLSLGAPPAEIMHGAISSLVDRFSAVDTTSADGT